MKRSPKLSTFHRVIRDIALKVCDCMWMWNEWDRIEIHDRFSPKNWRVVTEWPSCRWENSIKIIIWKYIVLSYGQDSCGDTKLVNLKFMEPCIARFVFYITNEMQLMQHYSLLSALYMFRAVFPPIIRSLENCICSLGYCHAFLFQPIHTSDRQQESMTIPKAAHTVL